MALLTADTEAGICCNGAHGVANSVDCGGEGAAVWTTEEMDPERVERPAALAGRVRGRVTKGCWFVLGLGPCWISRGYEVALRFLD